MSDLVPRVRFADHLPEIFRAQTVRGVDNRFFPAFLAAFEALYEELQCELEGNADRTAGGIPDLFDPAATPPADFRYGGGADALPTEDHFNLACLTYLASWIGLPLRPEKDQAALASGLDCQWNRAFFLEAIPLYAERGTRAGLDKLLRAWLRGDLAEPTTAPDADAPDATTPSGTPIPLVFDLTRQQLGNDTIFQFDDTGRPPLLGVDTWLGEGPAGLFIVDLVMLTPTDLTADQAQTREEQIDVFIQAARTLLELERPAGAYYQLRVRAQSAPAGPYRIWVYDSEGALKEITND